MKLSLLVLQALLLSLVNHIGLSQSPMVAADLRTEFIENPIGIDEIHPRLLWRLEDKRVGARQTAYRILVDTDSSQLLTATANVWDSDWVKSSKSLVTYQGKNLEPFTKYFWIVKVMDQNGKESAQSKVASFETGLIDSKNWKGAWIADVHDVDLKPAPYFRKEFEAKRKIKSARAYIAVAGLYELSLNGEKVGNHRLDPMYTRFDRRTLYVTHDVTAQIKSGKNAIGVLLGNGWYNHQSTAVWYFDKAPWRNRPAFCMDLRITYDDGSTETISTDKTWKTSLSPVIFNSIYTAEHYDARQEQPGWNTVDFNASAWKDVIYRAAPSPNIVAQVLHPIRNVEEIKAKTIRKLNDTTYVFDFGRNISGVSQLKVSGPSGTVIRLKHGERLYANSHVDISNIDPHYRPRDNSDPFQTDIVILCGKGEERFMPHFNYKGFQYVEVTSSTPLQLTPENLTGYFMHSDVPPVGTFKSSNETLNKILAATNNAYLSNLFGYPTDCPQREKNGWTGDAQIAIETGLYSFDGITIYEKWMADHRDEQQPNGVLPSIIPTGGWGYEWGNGPDWTSTIAIIPWNIYLFYGDTKILADNYENMKRYVDYIDYTYPTGLTTWGLGDWVPVKSVSPVELTSTCYYYADASILAKVARILNKEDDHNKYNALAEKIKKAFNEKYLNKEKGIYATGLQTELSVPLYWGLVPDEFKEHVAANLARRVEADNFHLDLGLLGQKAILNALADNGYADVAYKIAAQETYPSWGWWIKNGATTLYENWDINAQHDISLNHIMFGEIGAWFYKALAGIKPDAENPGFSNIILNPTFPTTLQHVESSYNSVSGLIQSSWFRKGKTITYTVTIPTNTTATFYIPQLKNLKVYRDKKEVIEKEMKLEAGRFTFIWK